MSSAIPEGGSAPHYHDHFRSKDATTIIGFVIIIKRCHDHFRLSDHRIVPRLHYTTKAFVSSAGNRAVKENERMATFPSRLNVSGTKTITATVDVPSFS